MELEKMRNLGDEELVAAEKSAAEQLFRLRFQKSLGNQEGVKKLRGLKLDIARSKTIARERVACRRQEGEPDRSESGPGTQRAHGAQAEQDEGIMADMINTQNPAETQPAQSPEQVGGRRNEKIGIVVSTKMQKTIVVEIEMRKAHPKYKRVMKSNKKFYAHDEQNSARLGDVVRIREMRPLSKLKRWTLEEIVRRSSLSEISVPGAAVKADVAFAK